MAFVNAKQPALYHLGEDPSERTDVAADNPDLVRRMLELAASARQALGEFMQPGREQRPTGSIFPDGPVISHEKDWGTVNPAVANAIVAERKRRHPEWKPRVKRKQQVE
jgi:hypothetical protein